MENPLSQHRRFWIALGVLSLCVGLVGVWHYASHRYECKLVSCLLQQDAEFSKQFDPHMQLFMESSSSRPLLEALPEFKQSPKFSHMLGVLTANVTHMRQSTPASPTCAVVGNSQNLTGSGYGALIDRHDFVFRMNSAPIETYTQDVGARTTHHIFSHFYAGNYRVNGEIRIRPYSPETFNVLIPLHANPGIPFSSTYKDYTAFGKFFGSLAEALSGNDNAPMPPLTRDNMAQLRNVSHLVVLTPDFLWHANVVWFDPQRKGERDIASTGFVTIILALHLCDQIDLFGFGATRDGAWGHYFDESNARPMRHHPSYQDEFLKALEAKRIIKIYRGAQ